ncbi:phosphatase PAP2 family protein [Halovivax gelatinilyticus]|uniref:phosphatase PAP2 family protein n=1 Tax=Halovivax gelatinilyticus TaxID=2961597 RepID=UPI0020CA7D45|nr:phosphatase PAP2 family protein [Halovivax gelatinilyticus]
MIVATSRRNVGLIDYLQDVVPEALAFPVALLTQLGAIWFAGVVLALVFVFVDRRDALVIAGLFLTGTGIWRSIKILAPVPRPEHTLIELSQLPFYLQPIYDTLVVQSGPGFPSGHAVTTSVLYLSLAATLTIWTRPRRYAFAVGMIALVGLTRITLGVHYTLDVIGGALIGQTVLICGGVLLAASPIDRVTTALGLGLASATFCFLSNLAVDPVGFWELGLFGGAVTLFGWWRYGDLEAVELPHWKPT